MKEISVFALDQRIKANESVNVIDVREVSELEIVKMDGAQHIPMGDIPLRMNELDKDSELIIMCKSGGRSAQVCDFLERNGYSNVTNLSGGIISWAQNIDKNLNTY